MTPLTWAASALAAPSGHAVVIGSNRPGAGQQVLRHAVDDAERMAAVLQEIGGHDADRIHLLRNPDPADIQATLAGVRAAIATAEAVGESTTLTFYYSGHARSSGLSLGDSELDLATLRGDLEAVGADLTLVVLDACQSGAFSTAKGIEPAADFSHNSIDDLTTTGIAVIASSTDQELSQESPTLGGSFFTHHLVSGMRGAADEDLDGLITLSEAYRYAHHRTLIDTSITAIGSQHVTLETALTGSGELVLTRPVEASARLRLSADEAAELMIHHEPARVVAMEVHKVAGAPMDLALIPGDYTLTLRDGGSLLRCPLALFEDDTHDFTRDDCSRVRAVTSSDKGSTTSGRWMVEIGGGLQAPPAVSAFTERLTSFGYTTADLSFAQPTLSVGLQLRADQPLSLLITGSNLTQSSWQRRFTNISGSEETDAFSWRSSRLGVYPRATATLGKRKRLQPTLQAGGGPALALTDYSAQGTLTEEAFLRWHVAGAVGLAVMSARAPIGGFLQLEAVHAPLPVNLLDDRHDSGGLNLKLGIRAGS